MKYGVFSVSMPEYNPEDTLKVLKELGYDGVEWRVTNMPKEKPENVPFERRYWAYNESTIEIETIEEKADELKALCDSYGIEIFSLTTYLTPADYEKVEPVLRAAQKMGVKKIRVFPPSYQPTDDQTPYPELMYQNKAYLKKLEALGKKYGVKIMMEIHMNNLSASPSAAYRLVEGCDPAYIGVIFDPGNMVNEGYEDYQKAFELLGPYIAHVHVKNAVIVEDGRDELGGKKWKHDQAPLWDGMADLKELFRVMKKFGYDDTISVEDFSNESSTYDKLKANIEYIKKLAASV